MKEHGISVRPGDKLCPSCRMKVEKQKEIKDLEPNCEGDDEYDDAEAMEQEKMKKKASDLDRIVELM